MLEAVFKARNIGWSRERIGSHIIRNNRIYDCGQNGITGHLGCICSEIYGNEIDRIAVKHDNGRPVWVQYKEEPSGKSYASIVRKMWSRKDFNQSVGVLSIQLEQKLLEEMLVSYMRSDI